jgi:hypothetical protein
LETLGQKRSKGVPGENLARLLRAISAVCGLLDSTANGAAPISPDHPELLQQGIVAAYAAGQKSVVIPAGVYLVPSQTNGRHLDLENMSNFEIDAARTNRLRILRRRTAISNAPVIGTEPGPVVDEAGKTVATI